ncbi:MAG TPA: hypothetical protein VND43_02155 [Burkholderiales bacterium]|nr:hypothetical protein [Burkholderiales bacterium]
MRRSRRPEDQFLRNDTPPITLVALTCLFWIVLGLVGRDIWKPIEPISFDLVHRFASGDPWYLPVILGKPFLSHPAFYYLTAEWSGKVLGSLFGYENAVRLINIPYLGICILGCSMAARESWGKGHGRLCALILISTLGILVRSHQLTSNVGWLAAMGAALYSLALASRRPLLSAWIFAFSLVLAFYCRGIIDCATLMLLTVLLPVTNSTWRLKTYYIFVLNAIGIALPWLLIWPALLYTHNPILLHGWLNQILENFQAGEHQRSYFLSILPWFSWPALPLALWAVWHHRHINPQPNAISLGLATFIILFIMLTLASDPSDQNAMILILPLALIASGGIYTLRRGAKAAFDWFGTMTFGLFGSVIWIAYIALVTGFPEPISHRFHVLQAHFVAHPALIPMVTALFVTIFWIISRIVFRHTAYRAITNWALGLLLIWGLLCSIWLPYFNASKSYRGIMLAMAATLNTQHGCISSIGMGYNLRAFMEYYDGIITHSPEEKNCTALIVHGQSFNPPHPGNDWIMIWQGSRVDEKIERFWIFRKKATGNN